MRNKLFKNNKRNYSLTFFIVSRALICILLCYFFLTLYYSEFNLCFLMVILLPTLDSLKYEFKKNMIINLKECLLICFFLVVPYFWYMISISMRSYSSDVSCISIINSIVYYYHNIFLKSLPDIICNFIIIFTIITEVLLYNFGFSKKAIRRKMKKMAFINDFYVLKAKDRIRVYLISPDILDLPLNHKKYETLKDFEIQSNDSQISYVKIAMSFIEKHNLKFKHDNLIISEDNQYLEIPLGGNGQTKTHTNYLIIYTDLENIMNKIEVLI